MLRRLGLVVFIWLSVAGADFRCSFNSDPDDDRPIPPPDGNRAPVASDAAYTTGDDEVRQSLVYVITEFFKDQESAEAKAREEQDQDRGDIAPSKASIMPPLPEKWAGFGLDEDKLIEELGKHKSESDTECAQALMATESEIKVWRAYLASL